VTTALARRPQDRGRGRLSRWAARRGRSAGADAGNAMIEFVGLSVVLLIPFAYFFLAVFSVQRSAFAVTQAARAAGRAYVTADDERDAAARAQVAAQLAFTDQGLRGTPRLSFVPVGASCGSGGAGDAGSGGGAGDGGAGGDAASLRPGARFVVCVGARAPLPGTAALMPGVAAVGVNGRFEVVVDILRANRSQ